MLLLALTAALYAYTLRLPFFWDDTPILSWVMTHDWMAILFSTENGYYRPLAFAIYKLGVTLFPLEGGVCAAALHAIAPMLLWLSALLLMEIVGGERGLMAALFWVTYPFLNEAVAWITSLSHPLLVFLTLLALYAFLRHEAGGRIAWLGFLALILAPLAHESGVVSAWLVTGFLLIRRWHGGQGMSLRPSTRRWLGAALMLTTLSVFGRGVIPGVQTAAQLHGLHQLKENGFYDLQLLLFPLGLPIGYAVREWGWHDFTTLSAAALLVGAWTITVREERLRPFLAALWWWMMAALPATLALDFDAFFVGARLATFPGVGAVLFWATLIEATTRRWHGSFRRIVRVSLAIAILLPAIGYHLHMVYLYRLLDDLYDELFAVIRQAPDRPLTFINIPSALTWQEHAFPLLTDNVVFVPEHYTSFRLFLLLNVGECDAQVATYGAIYQETDPFWLSLGPWIDEGNVREFVVGRECYLGRYDEADGRFHLLDAGTILPHAQGEAEPQVRFEGGARLLKSELHPLGEGRYELTLIWQAERPLSATVFVHVVGADGRLLAQADGASLSGLVPLRRWQAGDRIVDRRTFRLPPDYRGEFTIRVGLYEGERRYAAFTAEGRASDDAPVVAESAAP